MFDRLSVDFAKAPLLVIWETTRSCALACAHCRASADMRRDPDELSTTEGKALIDQVKAMGTPILILSGGDPLNRVDLEELIRHAKAQGLRVGTIPAATDNLTKERLRALKEAGLDQVAFSIDGAVAQTHDTFRRTPGAFDKIMQGIQWAQELGIPIQINTCLSAWNWAEFDDLLLLVRSLPIVFWEVFFLIPVGRGVSLGALNPQQMELAMERLGRLAKTAPFIVKLTEGQQFLRFARRRPGRQVNAGDGFMFIDHLGGICPSGFLPEVRGNVRTDDPGKIYREDALFTGLRDHSRLKGKCQRCEYKEDCGGSRSRAKAMTGDAWASDPTCAYQPPAVVKI
jgi:AdoMet-dependent heme synthase